MKKEIKLGFKVKDEITGFEGIVIGITDWMYSCKRIGVRATLLVEGKPIEDQWFDVQQMIITEETKPLISEDSDATKPGGNKNGPGRLNHG
jgi:hypothetical protein